MHCSPWYIMVAFMELCNAYHKEMSIITCKGSLKTNCNLLIFPIINYKCVILSCIYIHRCTVIDTPALSKVCHHHAIYGAFKYLDQLIFLPHNCIYLKLCSELIFSPYNIECWSWHVQMLSTPTPQLDSASRTASMKWWKSGKNLML